MQQHAGEDGFLVHVPRSAKRGVDGPVFLRSQRVEGMMDLGDRSVGEAAEKTEKEGKRDSGELMNQVPKQTNSPGKAVSLLCARQAQSAGGCQILCSRHVAVGDKAKPVRASTLNGLRSIVYRELYALRILIARINPSWGERLDRQTPTLRWVSSEVEGDATNLNGGRKKQKPTRKGGLYSYCRRSPNLPHTYACSTIGPARLNFRVRDGNGCDPRSMVTGKLRRLEGDQAFCRNPECFARRISTPWNLRDLPDVSQRNRLGSNLLGAGLLLLLRPILQGLC